MSPQITPPSRPPKTIVLAFDGTANKFGACNTNVIRLFSMLEKEKPEEQVVYYQPGLGTYLASEAAWSPTEKLISELMDKAFALYLDVHIMDGYRFLMANYKQNDRVCMFGFSRGAYTARCLAGMLKKVGLLLPGNDQMVASAYERYLDLSSDGTKLAFNFKDAFSIECPIEFLGLWDTVSSVGIVNLKHLPFTASNSQVKTVRHALALDERRAKFRPNRWHQSSNGCHGEGRFRRVAKRAFTLWSLRLEDRDAADRDLQVKPAGDTEAAESSRAAGSTEANQRTNVMEVWFSGDHSDVGGGRNDDDNRPSNPSLAWMVSQIILSKAPILFKRKEHLKLPKGFGFASPTSVAQSCVDDSTAAGDISVESVTVSPNCPIGEHLTIPEDKGKNLSETTVPTHEDMQYLEQLDKAGDAKFQIHDSIARTWLWRIVEFLPLRHSTGYDGSNGWKRSIMPNRGHGRKITTHHVYIHESVLLRMEDPAKYVPRAVFVKDEPDIKFVNNSDQNVGKGILEARGLVGFEKNSIPRRFRACSSASF